MNNKNHLKTSGLYDEGPLKTLSSALPNGEATNSRGSTTPYTDCDTTHPFPSRRIYRPQFEGINYRQIHDGGSGNHDNVQMRNNIQKIIDLYDTDHDEVHDYVSASDRPGRGLGQMGGSYHDRGSNQHLQHSIAAVDESPAMQIQGIAQLQAEIRSLPDDDKEAYVQACALAADIVDRESSLLRFLQFEKYNAQRAAERITFYWKKRREIFGERAFLPMDINVAAGAENSSRRSAMEDEDIVYLKTSQIVLLPDDSHGRSVICFDASRRLAHSADDDSGNSAEDSHQRLLRLAFFMATVLAENESSYSDGFVAVLIMTSQSSHLHADASSLECLTMILNTFPISCNMIHMMNCTVPRSNFSQKVYPAILRLFGELLREHAVQVYSNESTDEMASKLREHGLSREGIPRIVGGTWSYLDFAQWRWDRMQGTHDRSASRTELVLKDCRELMSLAISALSQDAKAAYLDVMEKDKTKAESLASPMHFLEIEEFNPMAAANRLVNFWQLKSELFGSKLLIPPDQTGEGSLDRKDLAVLGTGFVNMLPDDNLGRPVICFDGSRLKQGYSDECRDRCMFYMLSVASCSDVSRREGIVILFIMDHCGFDRINLKVLERMTSCLPINIVTVHLLWPGVKPKSKTVELTFCKEVHSHIGKSKEELAAKMESFGLFKEGIPKRLGGSWGYEKFVQWQELQTRLEWNIPVGLSGRETSHTFNFPELKPLAELPEEERIERKRRMNVVHSRRKRDRERIEIEVLQEHCLELRDEQSRLQAEGDRLEDLVKAANAIVSAIEQYRGAPSTYVVAEGNVASPQLPPLSARMPPTPAPAATASPVLHVAQSYSESASDIHRQLLESIEREKADLAAREAFIRSQIFGANTNPPPAAPLPAQISVSNFHPHMTSNSTPALAPITIHGQVLGSPTSGPGVGGPQMLIPVIRQFDGVPQAHFISQNTYPGHYLTGSQPVQYLATTQRGEIPLGFAPKQFVHLPHHHQVHQGSQLQQHRTVRRVVLQGPLPPPMLQQYTGMRPNPAGPGDEVTSPRRKRPPSRDD